MLSSKKQQQLTRLLHDLKGKDLNDLRPKKFKYKSKQTKERDWFAYNEAQLNEMSDFITLVRNIVDDARREFDYIDDRPSLPGQQPKSPFDLAKAVLIQQFYQVSNRVAAGLARLFKEKLGLEEDLTYKDIERAYSNPDVQDILREVLRMSNEPIKGKEARFSIDGTGMETSIKQNYADDKGDEKKKAVYRMLISMVGVEYKMFSASAVNGPGDESPFLIPLLEETAGIFDRIDFVLADAMFYTLANCTRIAEIGAKPRIYPRIDAVINAKGSQAKRRMLLDLVENAQQWLEEYHDRSVSENVYSVLKCRFSRPFLKRRIDRLDNEGIDKVCTYNLRMLIYNHYTKGIEVKWLNTN
jgi:transposase